MVLFCKKEPNSKHLETLTASDFPIEVSADSSRWYLPKISYNFVSLLPVLWCRSFIPWSCVKTCWASHIFSHDVDLSSTNKTCCILLHWLNVLIYTRLILAMLAIHDCMAILFVTDLQPIILTSQFN